MLKSRPDATLVTDAPAYRRMMPFLMRTRSESTVYFDLEIDIRETRRFLDDFNTRHPELRATIFHVVLWAAVRTLAERPRLNRFTCGGRLWQREGIWISYSAKKRMDEHAPIVVIKRRIEPTQSFAEVVRGNALVLEEGRSDKKSRVDKELGVLLHLPPIALRGLMVAAGAVDAVGLLPKSFIDGDPMYASMFIANLGSLKMDAAYHHLYEYGNIPIFCVIGQTKEQPTVVDGQLVSRPTVTLRLTYDERVEDGLYARRSLEIMRKLIEDPHSAAGM